VFITIMHLILNFATSIIIGGDQIRDLNPRNVKQAIIPFTNPGMVPTDKPRGNLVEWNGKGL